MFAQLAQLGPLLSSGEITALKSTVESFNGSVPALSEAGLPNGTGAAKRRGQGMDLVDIRAYQLGDDVKAIDWHTTAKRGRPYIKVFEEEAGQPVHVFVQQDHSMIFATQGELKAITAARCACALTFTAARDHAPVSATVLREAIDRQPVAYGQYAIMRLVHSYTRPYQHPLQPGRPFASLRCFAAGIASPSRVFIVCNRMQALMEEEKKLYARLALRNQVAIIQIIDPIDMHLPRAGHLTLNMGGQETICINSDDEVLRDAYAQDRAAQQQQLHRYFSGLGVTFLTVQTNRNLLAQIAPLL